MIKKIEITKQNKTIPKNFILELGQVTVITGENNSGKTNFINEIIGKNAKFFNENNEDIELKDDQIVYIKAENIKPSDNDCKPSVKNSSLIENLSRLLLSLNTKFNLKDQETIIEKIENLINETNTNLKDFTGENVHKLKIVSSNKELDAKIIIQALIEEVVSYEGEEKRKLDELGQGTQRLIIVSILKAYVDIRLKMNILTNKQILILFEEPEIYLHPKLKRTLDATLEKIASLPNHQIIITTHDPYFVFPALDEKLDKKIFSFQKKNGMTEVLNEGLISGIENELLFIFLYSRLEEKEKKENKKYLKDIEITGIKDRVYKNEKNIEYPNCPHLTYIRHQIHHAGSNPNTFRCGVTNDSEVEKLIEEKKNFYTTSELSEAIQKMSEILGQK